MTQLTFSDAEYAGKRKQTRREVFLAETDQVVPWPASLSLIEAHYPKAGRGRRPYPLVMMLRVHLMQHWFGYSDPAMEAVYEVAPLRQFARLSLLDAIPDETTMLHFRHLLERHGLAAKMFEAVNGAWPSGACRYVRTRWWMPRSFTHPHRQRTLTKRAARTCTRRGRVNKGISG